MAMKPSTVRLSPAMSAYLKTAADHAGVSLSTYMRESAFGRAVFEGARRRDPQLTEQERTRRELARFMRKLAEEGELPQELAAIDLDDDLPS